MDDPGSRDYIFHVRVGSEFGDIHEIYIKDYIYHTTEKIKNEICKAIEVVKERLPSDFTLMLNGAQLLPEFRKFGTIEAVREAVESNQPIQLILAPVERDVFAARYNFYKYRSRATNQQVIIRVPKFPIASPQPSPHLSNGATNGHITPTNSPRNNNHNTPDERHEEYHMLRRPSLSSDNVRQMDFVKKEPLGEISPRLIRNSSNSNNSSNNTDLFTTPPPTTPTKTPRSPRIIMSPDGRGSIKLPRSRSSRWRRTVDDCRWVPLNELEEEVIAPPTTTPEDNETNVDNNNNIRNNTHNNHNNDEETAETREEGKTINMEEKLLERKGLIDRVKEMSHMEDPVTSRGSSEFYSMMKQGAAMMAAKERESGIKGSGGGGGGSPRKERKETQGIEGIDGPPPTWSREQSEKERERNLRKRVRKRKNRSMQSTNALWDGSAESPPQPYAPAVMRFDQQLSRARRATESDIGLATPERRKYERWEKLLSSYDELLVPPLTKNEQETQQPEDHEKTREKERVTEKVVAKENGNDKEKDKKKEEVSKAKKRLERRKKKKQEQEMKKAQQKLAEEEEKKKKETPSSPRPSANNSANNNSNNNKKENRMSRVLGDVKDLYELISESEEDLRKKRKEEEKLQREMEEQEQDEAASLYEFLGSGSESDSGDEVLIFSEDGQAVLGVPGSDSVNDVSILAKMGAGGGGGGVPAVALGGAGSGSDGENGGGIAIGSGSDNDDDGGLVFFTEEGENVKVKKENKKRKFMGQIGKSLSHKPAARSQASKKEIEGYAKKESETKKKKEKEKDKEKDKEKGKPRKERLKISGKSKSKLWF